MTPSQWLALILQAGIFLTVSVPYQKRRAHAAGVAPGIKPVGAG
jgi:hypothetical protein